jgi:hypothetical protein|tara:strand:+ start:766 stop:1344 length:579 start_codon:yes stop_codon:yes gene_type:complete
MPLEEDVKQDVRKWSELYLEVPNKHLGGMPACPFAKKTWKDNKVLVGVKGKHKWYKTQLNLYLKNIDWNKHELLIFCDPYFNYGIEDLQNAIDEYNKEYNKKDVFFMGFHPHNPANEEEQEFLVTPNGEHPMVEKSIDYSMMLAQKFSQLQEASDRLHKSGYYKLWPRGYYQDVVVSRAKTYKRIFGGRHDG